MLAEISVRLAIPSAMWPMAIVEPVVVASEGLIEIVVVVGVANNVLSFRDAKNGTGVVVVDIAHYAIRLSLS